MHTKHVRTLIAAVSGLAAFSPIGCAKNNAGPAPAPTADSPSSTALTKAAPRTPAAPIRWEDIQDLGYDQRTQFFAGVKRMESHVDAQMAALTARRAIMEKNHTATNAWDFAMKEMRDARSYLKSMDDELGKASRSLWDQKKAKVGRAWVRTQEAYKAVRSSTTN